MLVVWKISENIQIIVFKANNDYIYPSISLKLYYSGIFSLMTPEADHSFLPTIYPTILKYSELVSSFSPLPLHTETGGSSSSL